MLDVPVTRSQIQTFYSDAAPFYDEATLEHETKAKERGVALLARRPGERYLEVAVGTGMTFAAIVEGSGLAGAAGVDMAPGMMAVARERLRGQGVEAAPLMFADARTLPFRDASFDCLFNSYMIDLIPTPEIAQVIGEFHRVLRPGGRLVLVNLTEGEGDDVAFSDDWKQRYAEDPQALGACRPVVAGPALEACGFADVTREYSGHGDGWPSEVVTARRA